jgi:hypothetical protein
MVGGWLHKNQGMERLEEGLELAEMVAARHRRFLWLGGQMLDLDVAGQGVARCCQGSWSYSGWGTVWLHRK